MKTIKNLFYIIMIFVGITSLAMYISVLLGYEGFLISGSLQIPNIVSRLLCMFLMVVHTCLLGNIFWNLYDVRLFKVAGIYSVIYIVGEIMFGTQSLAQTFIIPSLYYIAIAVYFKSWKGKKLRYSFLMVLGFFAYTIIMGWIKAQTIIVSMANVSIFTSVVFSLDPIVLLLLINGKGMIQNAELAIRSNRSSWNLETILPIDPTTSREIPGDSSIIAEVKRLEGWEKIVASIVWIGQQILAWGIMLLICRYIGNILIEALVISACYAVFGYIVRYRWHSWYCGTISTLIFFISAKLIPKYQITQLVPIALALLLIYGAYRIAMYVDANTEIKAQLETMKKQSAELQ